jgi:Tol biopolymer transport system component
VLNSGSDFSASADGTLVWVDTADSRRLTWRDRSGKKLADAGLPSANLLFGVALSPDGTQTAYAANEQGNLDIWVGDLARGVHTRLTSAPGNDMSPEWSPTGQEIAVASERQGNFDVFLQTASGGGEPRPVVVSPFQDFPNAWSPDGMTLLFVRLDQKTGWDLWSAKRKDGMFEPPSVWLQTPFHEIDAVFSPDGRYVAYMSDESGRFEVYIRPAGGSGGRRQVSANGGLFPWWNRDGREIFYQQGESLLAVPVTIAGGAVRLGAAVELFRIRTLTLDIRTWNVHPDGKRFLIAETEEAEEKPPSIHVIENWPTLLQEKSAQ